MNRHTKVALMVAPFLILGGYIASDFYLENKADQERVFNMVPFGHCDVINQKCILKSGKFEVNIYDEAGTTTLNSTFPLDSATFFLVDSNNQASAYPMGMIDSPYYWKSPTPLRNNISNKGDKQKLRVIAHIKGGQYIAEFHSQTVK
ncbi:hypothetical protein [Colwellia sp. PAMC 21821]|uniref:hypothetical protein n=1 Tax=Colwellia sp. PAMC 21821 TaxID=1816219 RepID=UPI0009BC944F|nr:hypothetical protein [Colwellia sp. PAMC 21821]ARD44467.1 hypothetical protein A3Q33_09190 [Colwellia sp. PAMC 21821]